MLIAAVIAYLVVTVALGLWAARRVRSASDFILAGRSLPLSVNTATVFATWFGAETVLSVSATFTRHGLGGIVGDPFGASFCLVFVALFFARRFYRMNALTIGDYYRQRYNAPVELVTSLVITASYLGWTSAQLTALGLAFSVLSQGALSLEQGILLGGAVVLAYTVWGGMFSVAITDLFQSVVIVVGLAGIAWLVADMAGGAGKVVAAARDAGKFSFWPRGGTGEWLAFAAAFLTQSIGAIPQQDVYQRVTSARTERTAMQSCYLGAAAYCAFTFVPVFIAYAALVIEPSLGRIFAGDDARQIQAILPDLILERTPVWAQVLFFGALLSAILSTASGALLAPTGLFTENVLRPLHRGVSEKRFLPLLRIVLVGFTGCALAFSLTSTSTMYDMVQDAYKVTLVGAFVPLAAGLYWKRANSAGATLSMVLGIGSWAALELWSEETLWPPQLVGLAFATLGMVAGSMLRTR